MLKADVARLGEGLAAGLLRVSVHDLDDAVELAVHALDLDPQAEDLVHVREQVLREQEEGQPHGDIDLPALEQNDRDDDDHELLQDVDHGADAGRDVVDAHKLHVRIVEPCGGLFAVCALGRLVGAGLDERQVADPVGKVACEHADPAVDAGAGHLHLLAEDECVEVLERQQRKARQRKDPVVLVDAQQRRGHIIDVRYEIQDDVDEVRDRCRGVVCNGTHEIGGVVAVKIVHLHAEHPPPHRAARLAHAVCLRLRLTGERKQRQTADLHIEPDRLGRSGAGEVSAQKVRRQIRQLEQK